MKGSLCRELRHLPRLQLAPSAQAVADNPKVMIQIAINAFVTLTIIVISSFF